jgi:hypothetical protein
VRVDQTLFATFAIAAVVTASIFSSGGCGNNSSGSGGYGPASSSGSSGGPASTFGQGDEDGGSSSGLGGGGSGGTFSSGGGISSSSSGAAPTCTGGTGWACAVDKSCATSSQTTLTGKVYDPAGANPLYNALVFIPSVVADLPVITPGTSSCNTCDASVGDYVAIAQTDATGSFTLTGVPTGTDVPVTVQMGKWRRTVTVSITKSCATTTVAAGTLRLPANHTEGDMPQMALLTGGCDDMACFLTNLGIADSEFTAPHAGGRVDVYQGGGLVGNGASLSNGTAGDCTTSACPLWQSKTSFESYDIALFSCECSTNANTKPASAMTALDGWLNEGGKVFASHFHYYWFQENPTAAFQNIATWLGTSVAGSATGPFDVNNPTSFPKGQIYADWLMNVGAITALGPPAPITLNDVATSVSTVNTTTTQQWIYDTSTSPNNTKYLSFDTPIGGITPAADAGEGSEKLYCGKAVFTDLHTGGSLLAQYASIPADCPKTTLSAQQKALEFLFFDLSACVSDDSKGTPPPPPPPQ